MDADALSQLEVVVPNLHRRFSGVTATNRTIAPRVARLCRAAWFGAAAPEGMPRIGVRDLLRLRVGAGRRAMRVWHARRNNEMIVGWLLRSLGWRFKLAFTSEAQRNHTWITRFLIARMDAITTSSERSASFLARAAHLIPHGVDTDIYRPPANRDAAYEVADLPGKYGIGCFGRVRAQKGTDVFVEAMCRLLPAYPDFTAIVVGQITAEQTGFAAGLKQRVRAAGLAERVRFVGEVESEEVPQWYRRILIYAFTSRNEGFGLTLVEAMASGAALVAARAGAAEAVVTDGETGILVPPGDIDALVAALEPLMREPARAAELGRRARQRALAAFSVENEARHYVTVYRELLASA